MQTTDRSCAAGDWSDVVPRRSAEQPVHDCALRAYPSGCSRGGLAGGSGRQLVEATLEQPHRLPAGGDGGGEGTLDPVDADEKALGGVGVDRQVAVDDGDSVVLLDVVAQALACDRVCAPPAPPGQLPEG